MRARSFEPPQWCWGHPPFSQCPQPTPLDLQKPWMCQEMRPRKMKDFIQHAILLIPLSGRGFLPQFPHRERVNYHELFTDLLWTLFAACSGFSEELQLCEAFFSFKREEKKTKNYGNKANKRRVSFKIQLVITAWARLLKRLVLA